MAKNSFRYGGAADRGDKVSLFKRRRSSSGSKIGLSKVNIVSSRNQLSAKRSSQKISKLKNVKEIFKGKYQSTSQSIIQMTSNEIPSGVENDNQSMDQPQIQLPHLEDGNKFMRDDDSIQSAGEIHIPVAVGDKNSTLQPIKIKKGLKSKRKLHINEIMKSMESHRKYKSTIRNRNFDNTPTVNSSNYYNEIYKVSMKKIITG